MSSCAVDCLNPGDVANGEKIGKALFENLKKYYGQQGFIEYTAEPTPTFKDNPQKPDEGIVDFVITIEEGKQFSLRRLEFIGNTFTRDNVLRREVLLNEGDIYNQTAWEYSIIKLNQLGYFDPIDKDKDADFKTNEEEATVDLNLKVAERGRQQISFNGGLSGIGGSFFGLEYSTNNLLGRGEILSLNLSAGNRQKYLQFSFTEPYIKNRPITAGFSLFGYTQKFFGEGTFLSQNIEAQQGLSGSQFDFLNVSEENLFTRTSYGGTLFHKSAVEAELLKMEAELEAAYLLTLRAAWMADNRMPNSMEASMAKAKAGRVGNAITLRCVELCGAAGYGEGELLEKWARDSKILDIFEGTQQIQMLVIARRLLELSSAQLR